MYHYNSIIYSNISTVIYHNILLWSYQFIFSLSIYGCTIQTKLYHDIWRQRTNSNYLSAKQQLFRKRDEQIHLPFTFYWHSVEGMPQLICLCFLLAFVIVDMSLGKQDHPYNKETTMHENSNKLPVQCLTWNFNTGV